MRFINWAEGFKKTPTCDDILKRVRKVEVKYWIWLIISLVVMVSGMIMLITASESNIKQQILGLFIGVIGLVWWAVIKIWAHMSLNTLFIIWDRNNTIEAEINKLESDDQNL